MGKMWLFFSHYKRWQGFSSQQTNIEKRPKFKTQEFMEKCWSSFSVLKKVGWSFGLSSQQTNIQKHPKFKLRNVWKNVGNCFLSVKQNGWSFGLSSQQQKMKTIPNSKPRNVWKMWVIGFSL